jgi:hypothetical protein
MATATNNKTIVGVFNSLGDAQRAVQDLEMEGISRGDISLIANQHTVSGSGVDDDVHTQGKASDVAADAGIGAAIGGVGGLLLSAAGALTVPVIGPILAAGPIAAALAGAGIGAAAGGLLGALTESGIPEEDARYIAEGIRRGDVVVTVKSDSEHFERARDILDQNGAVDIDERVSGWRERGWSGFDETAQPYTREELHRERSLINSGTNVGMTGMGASGVSLGGTPSIGAPTRGNTGVNTSDDIRKAHDRRYSDTEGDGSRADSLASTNYGAGEGRVADLGNAIEDRMDRGADKLERGAKRTGNAVERGMENLGDKIERGWNKMTNKADDAADELRDDVNRYERRRGARVYDYRS